MTNETKLKPCPFCGGEDVYCQEDNSDCSLPTIGYCPTCRECLTESGWTTLKTDAVDTWNHRPVEDALSEQLQKIQQLNESLNAEVERLKEAMEKIRSVAHLVLPPDRTTGQIKAILKTSREALATTDEAEAKHTCGECRWWSDSLCSISKRGTYRAHDTYHYPACESFERPEGER